MAAGHNVRIVFEKEKKTGALIGLPTSVKPFFNILAASCRSKPAEYALSLTLHSPWTQKKSSNVSQFKGLFMFGVQAAARWGPAGMLPCQPPLSPWPLESGK